MAPTTEPLGPAVPLCYAGPVKTRSSINAIIAKFAQDLEATIRAEVREQLLSAIDSGVGSSAAHPERPAARAKNKSAMKPAPSAKKRVRRSPEEITEIQGRITSLLSQGSKLTSEEIQEQLGLDKEAIQRPLQLLRESAEVKTVGELRSMRYFVGAGRAGVVRRVKDEAAE